MLNFSNITNTLYFYKVFYEYMKKIMTKSREVDSNL